VEKQYVLHILIVLFVALGIQHAMRQHLTDILGLSDFTYNISPPYLVHDTIFEEEERKKKEEKKKLLQVKRVVFPSKFLSEIFLILRITEQDMIKDLY
jgi:hypothetical protein